MIISQAVTLDILTGAATVGNILFMQRESDGRQLEFTVLNNGVAYTLTGFTDKIIVIEKPDGEIIYNDLTNVTKNTAKYTFTSQSQIVKGLLRCWLKFKIGEKIVVTPEFHVRVNEVADFDAAAESTSEFGVLDSLIEDASVAVDGCNAATDAMTEMTEDFENATATATTLAEGEAATVSLTDGVLGKEFAFGIPKGDKGDKGDKGNAATVEVGTVTTLDAGESVTVVNSGDEHSATFDFGIPKGDKGDTGEVTTAEMNAAIAAAVSITLTNLVTNGDFVDATGWTVNSGTLSAANNTGLCTANGTNLYSYVTQTLSVKPASSKIYAQARARVTNTQCANLFLRVRDGGAGTIYLSAAHATPTNGEWYTLSGIATTTSPVNNLTVRVDHFYASAAIASGKVMEVQYVSCVDITAWEAALGRAITAAQMAMIMNLYDGWFNGSVNLSWFDLIMTIVNSLHP